MDVCVSDACMCVDGSHEDLSPLRYAPVCEYILTRHYVHPCPSHHSEGDMPRLRGPLWSYHICGSASIWMKMRIEDRGTHGLHALYLRYVPVQYSPPLVLADRTGTNLVCYAVTWHMTTVYEHSFGIFSGQQECNI